ncbi:MAG: CinA family protein [Candidatus Methylumidiphilus sp.]
MNDEDRLYQLAEVLGSILLRHGHKLAVAESCTGGWICQAITDVAGSSAWFDRGFVTYTNEAKQDLLDVPKSILDSHGAVSAATVKAMTDGALRHSPADCALAVSGIAGPGGATLGKPVGTVWFAWQQREGKFSCLQQLFDGDRRSVRRQAVATALQGLLTLYG